MQHFLFGKHMKTLLNTENTKQYLLISCGLPYYMLPQLVNYSATTSMML